MLYAFLDAHCCGRGSSGTPGVRLPGGRTLPPHRLWHQREWSQQCFAAAATDAHATYVQQGETASATKRLNPQVVPFDTLEDRCGWKDIDIDCLSPVTVVKPFTISSLTSAKTYGNSVFTMVNRGFVLCGFYCSLCISWWILSAWLWWIVQKSSVLHCCRSLILQFRSFERWRARVVWGLTPFGCLVTKRFSRWGKSLDREKGNRRVGVF